MSTRPKRDTKPPNRFDEAPAPTKTTSHSPPAPLDDAAPPTKKLRLANKVSPPLEGTPVAATKKKPPPKLSVKKAKADTAAAQLAPTDASISVRAVGAISGDSTTIGPNLVENATKNLHVQSTPGASKSTPNDPIIVSPLPSTLSSTMRDPKRATTSLPIPKNKGNTPSSKKEASGKTPETTATKATPTADVNVQDAAARRKMLYGAVPSAPSFKKKSAVSTPDAFDRSEIKPVVPTPVTPVYQSAEERQRTIALARIAEKEKVQKGKLTAIDLLEDSRIMSLFEMELRSHVHALQAGAAKEDPNAPPLPRLLTYGSVFSLFPRGE